MTKRKGPRSFSDENVFAAVIGPVIVPFIVAAAILAFICWLVL